MHLAHHPDNYHLQTLALSSNNKVNNNRLINNKKFVKNYTVIGYYMLLFSYFNQII
jgi:hypothetical protein